MDSHLIEFYSLVISIYFHWNADKWTWQDKSENHSKLKLLNSPTVFQSTFRNQKTYVFYYFKILPLVLLRLSQPKYGRILLKAIPTTFTEPCYNYNYHDIYFAYIKFQINSSQLQLNRQSCLDVSCDSH